MQQLPEALAPLAGWPQFIGYRLEWDPVKNKMQKKPLHCHTGRVHSPTDPTAWGSFEQAAACPGAHGVGFVLTEQDPFWFLDIDHAWDGQQWSALSVQLCDALRGCAVEVSQSGAALHVIGTGAVPPHSCDRDGLDIQFYTRDRFVALTGTHASGDVMHDPGAPVLEWLVREFFPPKSGTAQADDWTEGPVPEWNGFTDDADLIQAACRATSTASVFGSRASFADLWCGDEHALSVAFPDPDRAYNASQADAALAMRLLFWTGKDCARTERLMRCSGLVRDKWDDRDDYLQRTILRAFAECGTVHQRPKPEAPLTPPTETAEGRGVPVTGYRLLDGTQALDYFAGCVYVTDLHRIFTPNGSLLKSEQFRAIYGGYTFAMDTEMRRTVRNAWEAFTENQAVQFPKVETTMFRPDLPPGTIFEFNGRRVLNSYVPVPTPRVEGDPTPFLDHLARILPDQRDQQILLAYMAACVQHRGVKFQWCPLIQGVEGNGKTLLSRVVAEAIGMQHVHSPKAQEISNKFNSWIRDKLFIYVEDVYYPDGRREVVEALKPIVTNDWQPVEPKGVDQVTCYVVANLMLNSNHRDAIRKTRNDRRFAVFYTAQQTKADIDAAGMGGDYFPRLYDWLKLENGYAIVANYLENYPIPEELNPARLCHRAPETSTTADALAESLGNVEQEILEAIHEGRPGFANGWVSSMALDRLLQSLRAGRLVPPNKRKELMGELGYRYHPGLHDGRVNNSIPTEGGKPRLYIREGHIHANLTGGAAIVEAYLLAQSFNTVDTSVNKGHTAP